MSAKVCEPVRKKAKKILLHSRAVASAVNHDIMSVTCSGAVIER